jgi:hypothetical protein
LCQAFSNDTYHCFVVDQATLVHDALRCETKCGLVCDRSAEHVSGGDMHHSIRIDDALALGALACALAPEYCEM